MQRTNATTTYAYEQPAPWMLAGCLWLYIIFVLYASLVPFDDWVAKSAEPWSHLLYGWQSHIYAFDVIQNLLFYLPIGALIIALMNSDRLQLLLPMVLVATIVSLLISVTCEALQFYKAERVSSGLDIFLNTLSGALGALLVVLFRKCWLRWHHRFNHEIMHPLSWRDPLPFCGLLGVFVWGLFQLYPYLPTLHWGHLIQGITPLIHTLNGVTLIDEARLVNYVLQGCLVYLLCSLWVKKHTFVISAAIISFVFVIKVTTIGRVLSLEAIMGTVIGVLIALLIVKIIHSFANREMDLSKT